MHLLCTYYLIDNYGLGRKLRSIIKLNAWVLHYLYISYTHFLNPISTPWLYPFLYKIDWVDGFKGSVHRPASEINSSWGWNSVTNSFTPNFKPINSGKDQCLDNEDGVEECQNPYLGKYQFGKDSMSEGSPAYNNRFTFYTPNVAQRIQNKMESKAVWSETSSTGFRKYNKSTKQMEEFINNDNNNRVPSKYRVPVTTIVGYYEPDSSRDLPSYIYPALHGAYGFVYDSDGDATSDVGCKLVVEMEKYPDTPFVSSLSSSTFSSQMNKFHVNVPTEDGPTKASVYCDGTLLDERTLDGPKGPLEYTVTGAPLSDGADDPPSPIPSSSPSSKPIISPTASPSAKPDEITCDKLKDFCKDKKKKKKCNKEKDLCKWEKETKKCGPTTDGCTMTGSCKDETKKKKCKKLDLCKWNKKKGECVPDFK